MVILQLIDRRSICSVIKVILDAKDIFLGLARIMSCRSDELDVDPYHHHDHSVFFHFHAKHIRELCTETNMGEMEDDTFYHVRSDKYLGFRSMNKMMQYFSTSEFLSMVSGCFNVMPQFLLTWNANILLLHHCRRTNILVLISQHHIYMYNLLGTFRLKNFLER